MGTLGKTVRFGLLLLAAAGSATASQEVPDPFTPATRLALAASAAGPALAITNVAVASPAEDRFQTGRTILIRNGRIRWVAETEAAELPSDVQVIDGTGLTAMPGLIDAHVHAFDDLSLGVLLAHGVTAVRVMSGSPGALEARERAGADVRAPRLWVGSPLLAGEEVPWPHILLRGGEEAGAAARDAVAAGYDFLKIYDGLTPAAYAAIAAVTDSSGVPFAGHVPLAVGVTGVLEAGQRSIAHLEQLLYGHFGRDGVMSLPFERLDGLVDLVAGRDVFLPTTLAGMERLMRRGTPWVDERFERPEMAWVDPDLDDWWASVRGPPPAPEALERRVRFLGLQETLAVRLHEAGVPLVAGTDTPYPLLVPGAALHAELEKLVQIGLTPSEALRTATLHPARLLGMPGHLGVIETGALGDLVLVEGDPLEDIGAIGRIRGVVSRGEWLDRTELDRLLDEAASAFARRRAGP
ncbi:MAG: amidohydrolase family protein [Gemmatimonadota bacterium]|nr:amidohydrolase family protein [Gemmatimonadota bacterium]